MKKLLFILLISISFAGTSQALLTPSTIMIPTSNGDSLEADLYLPNLTDTFPTILIQTPYGKYLHRSGLPLGVGINIASSNYAFVVLDWRGRFTNLAKANASIGTGEDGYDVVEWIATQTWSNEKIGTWGPSALGNVQFETAKNQPPNLTCAMPMVASPHFYYDDYFSGGAVKTEYIDQLDGLGYGIGAVVLANPFFNPTWNFLQNNSVYPADIQVPMLMVGGWFDHNTAASFFQFDTCTKLSPLPIGQKHHLLMGPWTHGGNGTANVGTIAQGELTFSNANGSDSIGNLFFDYYLRDIQNGWNTKLPLMYYQMGDNQWIEETVWPPTYTTNENWYLQSDNSITSTISIANNFSYNYDPLNPSPTQGGSTLRTDLLQGPYDQTDSVELRSDNVIFSTATLTSDLKIKGKIKVKLYVSSDKKDTDFHIRLTDVYPSGESILLNESNKRMRFRNGYATSDTASMIPGTVYPIEIDLPHIGQTFKSGHKLRVVITSSNYPKHNRNMNNGVGNMYPGNNPDSVFNPQIANNTIYVGGSNTSHLVLPVDNTNTSINEYEINNIKIYPNPTTNFITISSEDIIENIILYSINGEKLVEVKSNTISLKKYPKGSYFLEVETAKGVTTKKIVKQ
jgi:predicted acyl esterase